MVEGCLLWQKHGLMIPPRVIEETKEYYSDEDNVGAFIDFCCDLGDETVFSVGATEIYNAFEAWWRKYVGNFPPKQKKFGKQLRERFRCEKYGGLYRYFGIGLNTEVQKDFMP
jgi:putative DNA primase/helicase